MAAYEDMIHAIGQPEARWYVVPADHKWFAQLLQTVWKQFRLSGDKSRKLLSAMFEHSGAGCGLW
jgi:polyphosphate kinase 2 (PPK2 family)